MRKSDPNSILDRFQASANTALAEWQSIDAALADELIRLRRRAAADAFLALAVSWESFLSNWIVAAVNRDAKQAVATLETRMRTHAEDELRLPSGHVSTTLVTRSHLTVAEVHRLLDPNERNVVVRSQKDFKKLAETWMADPFRGAVTSLTACHYSPAVGARLVRNVLAHHSSSASKEANQWVRERTTPAAFRCTGDRSIDAAGWGRYLFTKAALVQRVTLFHNELSALSARLRV